MRISDWSSDVCSSDLHLQQRGFGRTETQLVGLGQQHETTQAAMRGPFEHLHVEVRQRMADVHDLHDGAQIGTTLQVVADQRSEEHTSELQSLMRISYAVFCLKKKNTNSTTPQTKQYH